MAAAGSPPDRNRTCDTRIRNPMLCPLSYEGMCYVERKGFEPSTAGLQDQCSTKLSYNPKFRWGGERRHSPLGQLLSPA
jgi:hypothetical protein